MNYDNSSNLTKRYFIASNLLSFLNLNATTTEDELEAYAVGIILNDLFQIIAGKLNPVIPVVTITFKSINIFNDEPFDPVWVNNSIIGGIQKDSTLPDADKEHAKLYTLSLLIKENLYNYVFIDFFVEVQKPTETLVEKRTSKEIEYDTIRQINCMIGYNFWGAHSKEGHFLIASIGASKFWDISIPAHRESGDEYYVYGVIFTVEGRLFAYGIPIGLELKTCKNYAPELRKLVETTDKYMVEASANISF